jgi:hypothetical protein
MGCRSKERRRRQEPLGSEHQEITQFASQVGLDRESILNAANAGRRTSNALNHLPLCPRSHWTRQCDRTIAHSHNNAPRLAFSAPLERTLNLQLYSHGINGRSAHGDSVDNATNAHKALHGFLCVHAV